MILTSWMLRDLAKPGNSDIELNNQAQGEKLEVQSGKTYYVFTRNEYA